MSPKRAPLLDMAYPPIAEELDADVEDDAGVEDLSALVLVLVFILAPDSTALMIALVIDSAAVIELLVLNVCVAC